MAYLQADVVGYLETGEVEIDVAICVDEDGRVERQRMAVWPSALTWWVECPDGTTRPALQGGRDASS